MDYSRSFADRIEETLMAGILGAMTVITFANVVARYAFNSNILWALELTVFMFGWLVLLGASYAVKKGAHLGVDIIVNMLNEGPRRLMALVAVALCLVFTFLMLKGAWDYWANFANLPGTDGRWFPLGFEEKFRGKGWYEVESVFMPEALQWMADVFNEGERYENIPRLIPYSVIPVAMALMLFRFIQVAVRIWTGELDRLVASHEVEDELAEIEAQQGRAS
ncbi:TRAP transporter small permease [Pelagibius sp. Alg239-R121]|uniref:TRAP transporter small permease n=1 Tax=Pelagibius sp. Alg239-R121 TaxID=2993448 RepID=UPI0024A79798|nr:TRAP transporter small permease [Pelagibius sp. Alg239-R121]